MSERTAVYHCFDAAGVLLYVGISNDPETRWLAHAHEKPWWPEVARKSVEWHPTRDRAFLAEARAIRKENPVHNIASTDPEWLERQIEESGEARIEAQAEDRVVPHCDCCGQRLPPLKICANKECRQEFYWSEAARSDAVFCSLACIKAQPEYRRRQRERETTS